MKNEKIINKQVNLGFRIFTGGIFLIVGLFTLEFYIGIVFLLVSIIAFTYSSGIEIDYDNKRVRAYTRYLWIEKGKWLDMHLFQRLKIRKSRRGVRYYGGRTNKSTSAFNAFYDVYLLPEKPGNGLLLFTSKNKDESMQFAEKWSSKLSLPVN